MKYMQLKWHILWLASAFAVAYFISNIFHELAHYISFKRYGLPIIELSFGVFRFKFTDGRGRLLWTPDRPFDALCSCKGLRRISNRERGVCLLAGGAINFVAAIILAILCLFVQEQITKRLLLVQLIACITNTCINIVNPYSADRKLLRQLNKQAGGSV